MRVRFMRLPEGSKTKTLWTFDELIQYLKIPKTTAYYYMATGKIPYIQLGRHRRFLPDDVEKALKKLSA